MLLLTPYWWWCAYPHWACIISRSDHFVGDRYKHASALPPPAHNKNNFLVLVGILWTTVQVSAIAFHPALPVEPVGSQLGAYFRASLFEFHLEVDSFGGFYQHFWVAVATVAIFCLLYSHFSYINDTEIKEASQYRHKIYGFQFYKNFGPLVADPLFMTLCGCFFKALDCTEIIIPAGPEELASYYFTLDIDPTAHCWEDPWHQLYTVTAIWALLLYVPVAMIGLVATNALTEGAFTNQRTHIRSCALAQIVERAIKLLLVMLGRLASEKLVLVLSGSLILVSAMLLFHRTIRPSEVQGWQGHRPHFSGPYNYDWVNTLKTTCIVLALWPPACGLLALSLGVNRRIHSHKAVLEVDPSSPSSWIPVGVMLMGWIATLCAFAPRIRHEYRFSVAVGGVLIDETCRSRKVTT